MLFRRGRPKQKKNKKKNLAFICTDLLFSCALKLNDDDDDDDEDK